MGILFVIMALYFLPFSLTFVLNMVQIIRIATFSANDEEREQKKELYIGSSKFILGMSILMFVVELILDRDLGGVMMVGNIIFALFNLFCSKNL